VSLVNLELMGKKEPKDRKDRWVNLANQANLD